MLLKDSVRLCFAALLGHLLSLLACLCASGVWQAIVGDATTLAERVSLPKSWPMVIVQGLFSESAQAYGAPPPRYWGDGVHAPPRPQPRPPLRDVSRPPAPSSSGDPSSWPAPHSTDSGEANPGDVASPQEQDDRSKVFGRSRTRPPQRSPRGQRSDPLPAPVGIAEVADSAEAARLRRRAPHGPCGSQDAGRADTNLPSTGESTESKEEEELNGTRGVPAEMVPSAASNIDRGQLADEAEALQGLLIRCPACNWIISHDAIVCPTCSRPTQRDLTEEDATYVQGVAQENPQRFQEAIDRAKEGAAAQAATAVPAVDPDTGLPPPPPAGSTSAPTATHVAGVRIEVAKAKKKLQSLQAKLSGKWTKYHNTSVNRYQVAHGCPHQDPKFQYIAWRWHSEQAFRERMETREDGPDFPQVNLDTIDAYYRNDMFRCFPHDRKWWGKALCQPHSGVPVPKRILAENTRAVRVMGGDAVTEIYPAAERRNWRETLGRHNLVLGGKQGGKRSYVDARPMAPSPAAQSDWNDPHGSWSSPQATHVADNSASWAGWEQPHGYSQGASSSGHARANAREAAQSQSYWEHDPRPIYKCPICDARTPRGEHGYGWCQECRGYPWMCDRWVERRQMYCNTWNPPWRTDCLMCAPDWHGGYDNWRTKRRR